MDNPKSPSLAKRIPWNKGITIDRSKYPNMGHLQKHSKESLVKITNANRANAKNKGEEFYKRIQVLAIQSGLAKGSYKGTSGKTKELSAVWKGDEASYSSKHKWIQKYWVKTGTCQKCAVTPPPYGNRNFGTEWANVSGQYDRRDKTDWLELCKKCHRAFDRT